MNPPFLEKFQSQLARAPAAALAAPAPIAPPVVSLRDYQEAFVRDIRIEYRNGTKAVLLVAATGAGKTVVFSYIARQASNKGKRVLILAHRDQLIKQASRKLSDNSVKHGIIMAGFTPAPHRLVQVASVQTLVRRIEKMKAANITFDMIVVDEAHLSAAKSYMDILAAWPDALVLGVTGSPARLDGKGLGKSAGGVFEKIVSGISIKQLIEQGYLVQPMVFASKAEVDLSQVKMVGGEYDSESLASVMDKPVITGSAIEAWKKHCPGVPAVAWCASVKHAQHVAEQFNAAGIPALALSGESSPDERDRALAALSDGRLKVITFAMLLVEGVDCPAIGAVIMLRPTMSLASYLQTIGRGLRTIYAPGMPLDTIEQRHAAIAAGPKGPYCFCLDHAGLWKKHGFATDEREWSLEGVKKKKGKKKEADDGPKLIQCPKCYMVSDPTSPTDQAAGAARHQVVHGRPPLDGSFCCPGCGHQFEIKVRKLNEVEGELALITPEMAELARRDRVRQQSGAQTLADLEKVAAERGFSRGWAKHVYEARERKKSKKAPAPKPAPLLKPLADRQTDMVKAFAGAGITAEQLEAYLEHPIAETTAAELTRLSDIFKAIKNGASAADYFAG